jgi:hypothetical protein
VAGGGGTVDDEAGDFHLGPPGGKTHDQRGDRLALALGVDDEDHREAEGRGEIAGGAGSVGGAVEEAHDAFDEEQVGVDCMIGC